MNTVVSSDGAGSADVRGVTGADVLARRGIYAEPAPAPSERRFPDGAHHRIEIPSVEGPAVLRAVVAQAATEGITVNRVSQGSGAMLLSAAELAEMARIGADTGIEVSLFIGPREEWDVGSVAQSGDGPGRAGLIRGVRQLRYAIDDVLRGVDHGIRGFLVADAGLLELLAEMQSGGEIPASVVWKVSAMLAPANPLTVTQLERLGASTINVPADVTLGQLAEMRSATSLPLDLYVEAPTGMGGVVRGQEAADLVAVAAPMYVKFGLRNSRLLYPSGLHLVDEAAAIAREKVHRARVALEWMERSGLGLLQSQPGAVGLGVPEP
jgi:Peptidase family U32